MGKKYIKTKDNTLMQYQINFKRWPTFKKKGLKSVLIESEQKLGFYKEYIIQLKTHVVR